MHFNGREHLSRHLIFILFNVKVFILSMYLFYIKKRRCHHFFIIVNIILSVSMQNDNLPFKITACVYKIV